MKISLTFFLVTERTRFCDRRTERRTNDPVENNMSPNPKGGDIIRPKNTCVSANMPKKTRVGKSENLFIFCQFLFVRKRSKMFIGAKYRQQYLKTYI